MKTALVTGGSRGIGLAIALELGRSGYAVAIMATKPESAYPQSTQKLREAGVSYSWHAGDIANTEDRLRVVDEVAARHGRIDVLVNNAGVAPKERSDLLQMTEESFDYVVGTNTKGNMFMTQAVARRMIQARTPGIIVNISSCSAEVSSVNRGEYCVSKAGISMLTRLFADRLAGEGIRVYEVRPGVIQTDMTAAVMSPDTASCRGWPRKRILDSARLMPALASKSWTTALSPLTSSTLQRRVVPSGSSISASSS